MTTKPTLPNDPEVLKRLAIEANNRTWTLLQKPNRSPAESASMLSSAYASLHLWDKVGTDLHRARGHWLLSRVLITLGEKTLSLKHAEFCAHFTELAGDAKDFDSAYALEAIARVFALNGDPRALTMRAEAQSIGESIEDLEDRKNFLNDLAAEPWFGIDSKLN